MRANNRWLVTKVQHRHSLKHNLCTWTHHTLFSTSTFTTIITMLSIRSLLIFIAALIVTVSAGTNQEGLAFLKAKEAEDGVVKLDSGMLYKEQRPGNGSTKKAQISTPCKCHYAGTLIDGTEFDSSYKRGSVRSMIYIFGCLMLWKFFYASTSHLSPFFACFFHITVHK